MASVKRKISSIKCPKCKGKSFGLSELHAGSVDRHFNNGVWDGESAINQNGHLNKVVAFCRMENCSHNWPLKGIETFDDLECDKVTHNPSLDW